MKWRIYQQAAWDELIQSFQPGEFLQSAAWAKVAGGQCLRLWVSDQTGRPLAAMQILRKQAGPFAYGFAPRGPLYQPELSEDQRQQLWRDLQGHLRDWLPQIVFCRVEPPTASPMLRRVADVEPAKTRIVDLSLAKDDMLAQMHQKTRYNMRLAHKKGVTVRQGTLADFPAFWSLMSETGQRDGFGIHQREHYYRMLAEAPELIRLYVAEWQGQVLAVGLFAFWGETVTYVHGASSSQQRNLMAPYALHEYLLTIAKESGFRYYDLFGVDERKWPGVSRFKAGFGGWELCYAGTFDLVLAPLYYELYRVLKIIKSIERYVGQIVKKA